MVRVEAIAQLNTAPTRYSTLTLLKGVWGRGRCTSENNMRILTKFSKENRKKQTPAEKAMRLKLLRWKIRFRSQRTFVGYIVDFLIPDRRIIIEVDGGYHKERHDYDTKRTQALEELGFGVIRVLNEEVLHGNVDWIREEIESSPIYKITNVKKAYGVAIY